MIVSYPQVNLSALRDACKHALNRDLSTNIKGSLEPLAVLSKLHVDDEYNYPFNCQVHLNYTLLLFADDFIVQILRTILYDCVVLSEETTKQNFYLLLVTGSLGSFVVAVRQHSRQDQISGVLSALNSIQHDFETIGYSLLFKDYTKEKIGENWYLKEK